MRKAVLFVIILASFICFGCDDSKTPDYDESTNTGWITKEYKGHTYIFYSEGRSLNGMVHDPECPCHKSSN